MNVTAQRPEASSSRSHNLNRRLDHACCCSTPGGVIVSITFDSLEMERFLDGCSTPGGVIVSITATAATVASKIRSAQRPRRHRLDHSSSKVIVASGLPAQRPEASSSRSRSSFWRKSRYIASAQRPEASSSRSRRRAARIVGHKERCSTPGGVIVSITMAAGSVLTHGDFCSTPGGVIVSITLARALDVSLDWLCSTPGGVIVSITLLDIRVLRRAHLLNARRRHRLDHSSVTIPGDRSDICSTPGGVIVSITTPMTIDPTPKQLLNARRRHRLDHAVTERPVFLGADLLNARRRHRLDHIDVEPTNARDMICSTPGGVIVSITLWLDPARRRSSSAQRPEASSSRSPPARKSLQANLARR